MLITDLLNDLDKFGENEIEFYLAEDKDGGDMIKLELFLCDGKYLYKKKDENGNNTDIVILGLTKPDANTI